MKIKYISFKAQDEDGKKVVIIDIFGVIGESFFEEGSTMENLKAEITKAKPDSIRVNISSLGGDAFEGIAIHDLIKSQKIPTEVNIVGATASAAAIIAQAGDVRNISENALFLIHNSHGLAFGGAEEMKRAASDMELIDKQMTAILDKASGDKSKTTDITALMHEDKFIDAVKAEEMGFVDNVVEASKLAASAAELDWDEIAKSKKLSDDNKLALVKKYKSEGDDDSSSDDNNSDDNAGDNGSDDNTDDNSGDDNDSNNGDDDNSGDDSNDSDDNADDGNSDDDKDKDAKKEYKQHNSFADFVNKYNPFAGNKKSDNGEKKEGEQTEEEKKQKAEFDKLKKDRAEATKKAEDLESKLRREKQKNAKASGDGGRGGDDPESIHGEDHRTDQEKDWDKNAKAYDDYEV